MIKIFYFIIFIFVSLYGSEYDSSEYATYFFTHKKEKKVIGKQYANYINLYQKSDINYTKEILKYWDEPQQTSDYELILYKNNYKAKVIIDYKKSQLRFEIGTSDQQEAVDIITDLLKQLYKIDIATLYRENLISIKVADSLNKIRDELKNNHPLLSDVLSESDLALLIEEVSSSTIKLTQYIKKDIYGCILQLPININQKKYDLYYKNHINKLQKKLNLPKYLLESILKVSSNSNVFAFEFKPLKFGLMDIKPYDIGFKAYYKTYGYYKFLVDSDFYNPYFNIQLGAYYLNYLYNDKFKDIKEKNSRIYCTIVSYYGNIQVLFDILESIENINKLHDFYIYRLLLSKISDNMLQYKVFKTIELINNKGNSKE